MTRPWPRSATSGGSLILGRVTFFPENTMLNGGLTPPGLFKSPVVDCSGAVTLVVFLDVSYVRGSMSSDITSVLWVSEDLKRWTTLGNMSSVTSAPSNERKQFQNVRGWRFVMAEVHVTDADVVLEFTGELFRTQAAGT